MSIQVGSIQKERKKKETVTLSQWAQNGYAEGRYVVSTLFPRSKGMNAALIFETEKARVKLRLSDEVWAQVKKELHITSLGPSGKNIIAYVDVRDGNIEISCEKYTEEGKECVYAYDVEKRYWKLSYIYADVDF